MWPFSWMMGEIDIPKGGMIFYAPVLFVDCEKQYLRGNFQTIIGRRTDVRAMTENHWMCTDDE